MQTIERDGIRFRGLGELLELAVVDYHASAVHLSNEELWRLGFQVEDPERADPSLILAALAEEERGGDPAATLRLTRPRGYAVGGLYLAAVREGLDVFVDEYDTRCSGLSRPILQRVGIVPLRVERRAAPARDPAGHDCAALRAAFREFEVAANTTGLGEAGGATTIEMALPEARVRMLPYRQFLAQLSGSEAQVAAEAGQAEAIERDSLPLFVLDDRVGEMAHFLVRRPTPVPRPVLPEVAVRLACLAQAERRELIARRRHALGKSAALVRILPWSAACPACRRPAMRAVEYEGESGDFLSLQRCQECELELAIATPPLVGLTVEEIARFAAPGLVQKLFPPAASPKAGEP